MRDSSRYSMVIVLLVKRHVRAHCLGRVGWEYWSGSRLLPYGFRVYCDCYSVSISRLQLQWLYRRRSCLNPESGQCDDEQQPYAECFLCSQHLAAASIAKPESSKRLVTSSAAAEQSG